MNRREAIRRLVVMCHREGMKSAEIASLLNAASVVSLTGSRWSPHQVALCLTRCGLIPHEAWREAEEEDHLQRERQLRRVTRGEIARHRAALEMVSNALEHAWRQHAAKARRRLFDVGSEINARVSELRAEEHAETFDEVRRACWPLVEEMLTSGSRYGDVVDALAARGLRTAAGQTWTVSDVIELKNRNGWEAGAYPKRVIKARRRTSRMLGEARTKARHTTARDEPL